MKTAANRIGKLGKSSLALIATMSLMGMSTPSAQAFFEMGYTFESPSTQASVLDFNSAYTAETFQGLTGPGYGPTLTAAAAKHGGVGLDFTSTTGYTNPGYLYDKDNYSWLWTQSSAITFQHEFTLSMWFNPSALPGSGTNYTLYWAGWQRGVGETSIALQPDGKLSFFNFIPFASISFETANTFAVGQWSHLAVTWDDTSDTLTLYKNGLVDTTVTGVTTLNGANTPTPSNLIFGNSYNNGGGAYSQYHGYMDDIYLSNFSHTQSEIQHLMDVIPEPSSVAMMGLGGLMLFRRLRKN